MLAFHVTIIGTVLATVNHTTGVKRTVKEDTSFIELNQNEQSPLSLIPKAAISVPTLNEDENDNFTPSGLRQLTATQTQGIENSTSRGGKAEESGKHESLKEKEVTNALSNAALKVAEFVKAHATHAFHSSQENLEKTADNMKQIAVEVVNAVKESTEKTAKEAERKAKKNIADNASQAMEGVKKVAIEALLTTKKVAAGVPKQIVKITDDAMRKITNHVKNIENPPKQNVTRLLHNVFKTMSSKIDALGDLVVNNEQKVIDKVNLAGKLVESILAKVNSISEKIEKNQKASEVEKVANKEKQDKKIAEIVKTTLAKAKIEEKANIKEVDLSQKKVKGSPQAKQIMSMLQAISKQVSSQREYSDQKSLHGSSIENSNTVLEDGRNMKGDDSSKKKLKQKSKKTHESDQPFSEMHQNEQELNGEEAEEEEDVKEYDRKEDSIENEVDKIQKYDLSNKTENVLDSGNDGDQLLKRCKTEQCQKVSYANNARTKGAKVKHITDAVQMQTENRNDEGYLENKKTNSTKYDKSEYEQIKHVHTHLERMNTQSKELKQKEYKQETDELSEELAKRGKEIDGVLPDRENGNVEELSSNISTNDQEEKGANDEHALKEDLEIIKENIDQARNDDIDKVGKSLKDKNQENKRGEEKEPKKSVENSSRRSSSYAKNMRLTKMTSKNNLLVGENHKKVFQPIDKPVELESIPFVGKVDNEKNPTGHTPNKKQTELLTNDVREKIAMVEEMLNDKEGKMGRNLELGKGGKEENIVVINTTSQKKPHDDFLSTRFKPKKDKKAIIFLDDGTIRKRSFTKLNRHILENTHKPASGPRQKKNDIKKFKMTQNKMSDMDILSEFVKK